MQKLLAIGGEMQKEPAVSGQTQELPATGRRNANAARNSHCGRLQAPEGADVWCGKPPAQKPGRSQRPGRAADTGTTP
ncbi:hypothetical protein GCM10007301_10100 [Azorhizobium oxalatiphilum]|uniref:Uncharacterized protein n=1 Tax=Azorhizobium oxalatiphilum TaxID=980631 RepID=A0A917F4U0_9HYPH|nr:hypothetical protein GCM10007301_10100 [Azorhizobium oxalatiphilum]